MPWLLLLFSHVMSQVVLFEQQGEWLHLQKYSVSVCHYSDKPVSVQGNTVWVEAQKRGLRPRTHAELQELLDTANRASIRKIALSAGEAIAWSMTVLVSTGVIGKGDGTAGSGWSDATKSIPALSGGAIRLGQVLVNRHAPKDTEIPRDYLPGLFQVPAGENEQPGCWVGSLIGE